MNENSRVIFITGAGSGFGRGLAKALDARGDRLCLADINGAALQETAAALTHQPLCLTFDVSQEADFAEAITSCVEHFGQLSAIVNNAGVGGPIRSIVETTEKDMDRYFAINTKSVLFGMKHAIPVMLQRGGGVVLNVASMAGLNGAPGIGAYCAAKHAVVGLTKTAALEFGALGVRVNAICPFFVPTPLVMDIAEPEKLASFTSRNPMGRMGTVDEIVNVMVAMLDPNSSYLNGQAIPVDGGFSSI
ncbi:MAG TPA: SDR family oxidoreductase [Pseudomonadales bacterium]|nr:SDR family oxidoreductase [Pseudomonadales bacterium]